MNDFVVACVVLAIVWGLVEFVRSFWQALIGLAVLGGLIALLFSNNKSAKKSDDGITYTVKKSEPQLLPMPYSTKIASDTNSAIKNSAPQLPSLQSTPQTVEDLARLVTIFNESLMLVKTSDNIVTVDGRFDDCLHFGAKLANFDDVYRKDFEQFKRAKVKLFDAAVDRYLSRQLAELENLRTERGKRNRFAKISATLDGLKNIPAESKAYAKKFLSANPVPQDAALIQAIPSDVAELLWFADGALKNYSPKVPPAFETKFFRITFPEADEPSLIRTTDFIGVKVSPAPKLDYFPTYAGMTPNERATYLSWLSDVDAPIDIGYVFVFYYGLERRLVTGENFQAAVNMIFRLRIHHANDSFNAYSSTALMAAALVHNRLDILQRLLGGNFPLNPTALAILAHFNLKLNADGLITLATAVGFTNKRYIKNEPSLFRQMLAAILTEKFSEPLYPLTAEHLREAPPSKVILFANVSLSEREAQIPDVARGESFRREVGSLLAAAHEQVKAELKARRK